MIDTKEIRSRMSEKGFSDLDMSKLLGVGKDTFARKMSGSGEFKCSEIHKLIIALDIDDVKAVFFN